MLLNDFYHIENLYKTDNDTYNCLLKINENHPVYKGHFPDNPITPGVFLIQITKELIEYIEHKKYRITAGKQIKFMQIINPNENNLINFVLKTNKDQDHIIKTSCQILLADNTIATKLNLTLSES